jgi:dienelactone hydrolase
MLFAPPERLAPPMRPAPSPRLASVVRSSLSALGLAGLAAFAAPAVRAEPPQTREEVMSAHRFDRDHREALITLPITVRVPDGTSRTTEFQLTHFRPAGAGPFPVAVVHHGRGLDRSYPSRQRTSPLVYYFLRRGFAVFVPTRVGYGGLGGTIDPEIGLSGCDDRGIEQQIHSVGLHTDATLAFALDQPWVDRDRIVIAGGSVGGYTSVAGGTRGVPGVVGILNFAGGVGGNPKRSPGAPCRPERVTQAFAAAARVTHVPTLWVYAENDRYWGAALPRKWFAAFVGAGGRGEFIGLPPIGSDGHFVVSDGLRHWRRPADQFLGGLGFAAPAVADSPPESGYAALEDASKLPNAGTGMRAGYERFLNADLPRAFVVGQTGQWVLRSGKANALADALERCETVMKSACKAYAVDDRVVYRP